MPQKIETVFEPTRIPLFPKTARNLSTGCSCPDPANPCKHTAAVFYLLGEQFDTNPFLIFTLRGRTREQVIEGLRHRYAAAVQMETVEETPTADNTFERNGSSFRFLQAQPSLARFFVIHINTGFLNNPIIPQPLCIADAEVHTTV